MGKNIWTFLKKLMIIIMLVAIFVSFYNVTSVGINTDEWKPGDMTGGGKIKDIGNDVIGILQLIGSITSVLVILILGIKYMLGSLEERATYKKTLFPYLIGAIMVFSITNILGFVAKFTKVFG